MSVAKMDVLLLGLLAERSAYGYELLERMRDRAVTQWTVVSRASVYQALRRLERGGYATGRAQTGREGPDRRTYRITRSGRSRLREGLLERFGDADVYETEVSLSLAFAHLLTAREARAGIARREKVVEERRSRLAEERARPRGSGGGAAATARLLEQQDLFAQAELASLEAFRRDLSRSRR